MDWIDEWNEELRSTDEPWTFMKRHNITMETVIKVQLLLEHGYDYATLEDLALQTLDEYEQEMNEEIKKRKYD
jgi:hypothetical protein